MLVRLPPPAISVLLMYGAASLPMTCENWVFSKTTTTTCAGGTGVMAACAGAAAPSHAPTRARVQTAAAGARWERTLPTVMTAVLSAREDRTPHAKTEQRLRPARQM